MRQWCAAAVEAEHTTVDRRRCFSRKLLVDDGSAHGIEMTSLASWRQSERTNAAYDVSERGVSSTQVSDCAARRAWKRRRLGHGKPFEQSIKMKAVGVP